MNAASLFYGVVNATMLVPLGFICNFFYVSEWEEKAMSSESQSYYVKTNQSKVSYFIAGVK